VCQVIFVYLTDEQRRQLEQVTRQAVGRVAMRAHMVLMSDRGYPVPFIAVIHACGLELVRTWLHRYEQAGVKGFENEPLSSRLSKDPLGPKVVDAQAQDSPRCSGLVQGFWTVGLLATFLAVRYRLLPIIRAMWMKKGQRVRVPTPGKNAKHAFFGGLEVSSGLFHFADHERKLAVNFKAFLEKLVELYPESPLYLVLDSAPTHAAKIIEKWCLANSRVTLLWLPKYSAHEVNPTERIWGLMKDKVAANRLAGSIGELDAHARHFFYNDLVPHPVRLPVAA
jgi:hypothetical protein